MNGEHAPGRPPLLRPLNFGEIFDAGFKVFTRNIGQLVLATAAVVVPIAILQTLVQTSIDPSAFDQQDLDDLVGGTGATTGTDLETVVAGTLVGAVISGIGQQFATAACFAIVATAVTGGVPRAADSLRTVARRLPSVLWLGLLVMLASIAPLVPGLAVLLASVPLGVVLLVFGLIGLLVLSVYFCVVFPPLLLEDKRGVQALRRSASLVKGRFWATTGIYVISLLLVSFVVGFVAGIILGVVTLTVESSVVIAVVSTAVTALVQSIVLPFTAAIFTLVYFDLRVRKEGFDLQVLAERIGSGPPATAPGPTGPPAEQDYGGFAPPTAAPPPPSSWESFSPPGDPPKS